QLDQFFFFSHPWKDNAGIFVAKLRRLGDVDPGAKVGIMLRDDDDHASAYAFLYMTPDHRVFLDCRTVAGRAAIRLAEGKWGGTVCTPVTLALVRSGKQYRAFISEDDKTWYPVYNEQAAFTAGDPWKLPMKKPRVGIAVCSHKEGALQSAIFTDVEFRPS